MSPYGESFFPICIQSLPGPPNDRRPGLCIVWKVSHRVQHLHTASQGGPPFLRRRLSPVRRSWSWTSRCSDILAPNTLQWLSEPTSFSSNATPRMSASVLQSSLLFLERLHSPSPLESALFESRTAWARFHLAVLRSHNLAHVHAFFAPDKLIWLLHLQQAAPVDLGVIFRRRTRARTCLVCPNGPLYRPSGV